MAWGGDRVFQRVLVIVLASLMALAGAWLVIGGVELIAAGGSFYYLPAGLALIATGAAVALRRSFAFPLFGILLAITLLWSLWEAGLNGWALVPRLVGPAVVGLVLL